MTGAALVYSSSLIAAFLGGILALFAPCCVVSLMPTFVGTALRQGRLRLPITTTVFAAGVAMVLLPVVLGIGALGSLLNSYHRAVYFGVSAILLVIGFGALMGRGLTLPIPMPRFRTSVNGGIGETFVLGIVSGVVSACCAPVLAGVIALSALSASPLGALGLGLSYVFGMVFPLFIAALLADRVNVRRSFTKSWRIVIADQPVVWTDAASGVIFLGMGALALTIAITNQSTITPSGLTMWSQWAASVAGGAAGALSHLPTIAQAAILIALAFLVAIGIAAQARQPGRSRGTVGSRARPLAEADEAKDVSMYTCPMHPEVANASPGTCPKSEVALEWKTPAAECAEWTCPMHPEVASASPGACPKCGMALESKSVESKTPAAGRAEWTCRMHPEIASASPGACPKCGMALESKTPAAGRSGWTCRVHPEIVRSEPGTRPICGMALEPREISAGEEENPELADMTRRF